MALLVNRAKEHLPSPQWDQTEKIVHLKYISSRGRVVKALDLKSNGIFPRRFEPCSQRNCFSRFPTSSFISVWTERCALYNENENEKLGLVRDLNPGPLAP